MQQAELLEILPELKVKVENYKLYGIVDKPSPNEIWLITAYNREGLAIGYEMPLFAMESKLKQMLKPSREIRLLEMVKANPMILSSIR